MSNTLIARITLLLLLCSPALGQQYYRWVDANGTMHFSEMPPPAGVDADLEQVKDSHLTRGLGDSPAASTEEASEESVAAAPAVNRTPGSTTNEEMCQRVRANLETLTNSPQIRRVDPDTGETTMMSSEQKEQELDRTRALEQQYC